VVRNVITPDTVNVMVGPHPMVVRILGIETPRITTQGGPGGCGWPQALGYAKQMLANTHVTLVADPTQPAGGPQGRDLRYLRLPDGSDYSILAVSAGWAHADLDPRHPLQEDAQLRAAQASAQGARRELWGTCPAPG
jgi:micrococcal nuclease